MTVAIIGRSHWEGEVTTEGHRVWHVRHKIRSNDPLDGPQVVLSCAGLPTIGSTYAFGNDVDDWAYCYPDAKIQMVDAKDDNTKTWTVDQRFSTLPLQRCNLTPMTDPVLEPQRVGGSFIKFLKAAVRDRYGLAITSSSWELFRGREVEFESSQPTVWVEQNVSNLGLNVFTQYVDAVNDSVLWGMNPRCVKLGNVTWERKQFGTCSYYYTRRFEFSIDFNTFDRYVQDEGTRVLNGHHGTTGSGCTINVTAVNSNLGGLVTTVTLGAGGSGYQASKTFALAFDSTTGSGASVNVTTNGSGVVTSVGTIINGGTGYIVENSIATTGTGWVLDNINGQPPNKNNPQHFIRYKDRRGECVRVILDGSGQPAINKYPGQRLVQKYPSKNMMILGIPTTL